MMFLPTINRTILGAVKTNGKQCEHSPVMETVRSRIQAPNDDGIGACKMQEKQH